MCDLAQHRERDDHSDDNYFRNGDMEGNSRDEHRDSLQGAKHVGAKWRSQAPGMDRTLHFETLTAKDGAGPKRMGITSLLSAAF